MSQAFRKHTGIGLGFVPLFAAVGALSVITTAPAMFRPKVSRSWPGPLDTTWRALGDFALDYQGWVHEDAVVSVMEVLTQASIVLVLLLPVAALVRSAREKSFEPVATTTAALTLGLLAFPIVLWLVKISIVVVRAGFTVWHWLQDVSRWFTDLISDIRVPLAVVFAIGVLVAAVWALIEFERLRLIAMWLGGLAVLAVVGQVMGLPVGEALGAAGGAVVNGSSFVFEWLLRIVGWVVLVFFGLIFGLAVLGLALGILAQIGTTFWQPLAAAWRAGRKQSDTADMAAGAGVAISVVLTAATVAPGFAAFFDSAVTSGQVGRYLEWVPLSFGALIPSDFEAALQFGLRGFTGVPEFALAALTVVIAIGRLILSPRGREADGPGRVATLAVARTTAAAVLAIPALVMSATLSDS